MAGFVVAFVDKQSPQKCRWLNWVDEAASSMDERRVFLGEGDALEKARRYVSLATENERVVVGRACSGGCVHVAEVDRNG